MADIDTPLVGPALKSVFSADVKTTFPAPICPWTRPTDHATMIPTVTATSNSDLRILHVLLRFVFLMQPQSARILHLGVNRHYAEQRDCAESRLRNAVKSRSPRNGPSILRTYFKVSEKLSRKGGPLVNSRESGESQTPAGACADPKPIRTSNSSKRASPRRPSNAGSDLT